MAALALLPAAAGASGRNLWATLNICDTPAHPDRMGVRARMPGDGTRERMYMRFTAQYRTSSGWRTLSRRPSSDWLYAGSARYRWSELGYTFRLTSGRGGSSYLLRGLVQFQWRRGDRVVHRTHLYTEAGHPTKTADPPGYSAARCRVSFAKTG